ncbi:MAG: hypothetical protein M1832_005091 [Thelocarpon impressellum]|nr:MAG: hypothetical protein M1832_005091 [Thelocarpon impressellum]
MDYSSNTDDVFGVDFWDPTAAMDDFLAMDLADGPTDQDPTTDYGTQMAQPTQYGPPVAFQQQQPVVLQQSWQTPTPPREPAVPTALQQASPPPPPPPPQTRPSSKRRRTARATPADAPIGRTNPDARAVPVTGWAPVQTPLHCVHAGRSRLRNPERDYVQQPRSRPLKCAPTDPSGW